MAQVYLGLGTNLGEKECNLNNALISLNVEVGKVIQLSSFYTSKSWGFESKNNFLNAVVLLKTELSPFQLLAKTQEIERKLGREEKTTTRYTDRVIDIDILLYDNLILNQMELKIPHPLLEERDFVLIPLAEIAAELEHPVLKKTFREILQSVKL